MATTRRTLEQLIRLPVPDEKKALEAIQLIKQSRAASKESQLKKLIKKDVIEFKLEECKLAGSDYYLGTLADLAIIYGRHEIYNLLIKEGVTPRNILASMALCLRNQVLEKNQQFVLEHIVTLDIDKIKQSIYEPIMPYERWLSFLNVLNPLATSFNYLNTVSPLVEFSRYGSKEVFDSLLEKIPAKEFFNTMCQPLTIRIYNPKEQLVHTSVSMSTLGRVLQLGCYINIRSLLNRISLDKLVSWQFSHLGGNNYHGRSYSFDNLIDMNEQLTPQEKNKLKNHRNNLVSVVKKTKDLYSHIDNLLAILKEKTPEDIYHDSVLMNLFAESVEGCQEYRQKELIEYLKSVFRVKINSMIQTVQSYSIITPEIESLCIEMEALLKQFPMMKEIFDLEVSKSYCQKENFILACEFLSKIKNPTSIEADDCVFLASHFVMSGATEIREKGLQFALQAKNSIGINLANNFIRQMGAPKLSAVEMELFLKLKTQLERSWDTFKTQLKEAEALEYKELINQAESVSDLSSFAKEVKLIIKCIQKKSLFSQSLQADLSYENNSTLRQSAALKNLNIILDTIDEIAKIPLVLASTVQKPDIEEVKISAQVRKSAVKEAKSLDDEGDEDHHSKDSYQGEESYQNKKNHQSRKGYQGEEGYQNKESHQNKENHQSKDNHRNSGEQQNHEMDKLHISYFLNPVFKEPIHKKGDELGSSFSSSITPKKNI